MQRTVDSDPENSGLKFAPWVTGVNHCIFLELSMVRRGWTGFSRGLSVSDNVSGPHKDTVKSFL